MYYVGNNIVFIEEILKMICDLYAYIFTNLYFTNEYYMWN